MLATDFDPGRSGPFSEAPRLPRHQPAPPGFSGGVFRFHMLFIVIRLGKNSRDKRLALSHAFDSAPVNESRLISRIQGQGFIQAFQSSGLVAQPGVSQSQVAVGLDMLGVLLQDLVKELGGLFILLLAKVLESAVEELLILKEGIERGKPGSVPNDVFEHVEFFLR